MGLSRADKLPIQPLMLQQRFKGPSREERVKIQEASLGSDYYLVYDKDTGAGYPVRKELINSSRFILGKNHFEKNKSSDDTKSVGIPFPIKIIQSTFSLLELASKSRYFSVFKTFSKKMSENFSPEECQDVMGIIKYLGISLPKNTLLVYEKDTSHIYIAPTAENEVNSSIIIDGILEITYPIKLFMEFQNIYPKEGAKKGVRLAEICLLNIDKHEKIDKINKEVFNEMTVFHKNLITKTLYSKKNNNFTKCLESIKAAINLEAVEKIYGLIRAGFNAMHTSLRGEDDLSRKYYSLVWKNAFYLKTISKKVASDVWLYFKKEGSADFFETIKAAMNKLHIAGFKDLKESPNLYTFVIRFQDMVSFELEVKEKRDKALQAEQARSGWKYWMTNAWARLRSSIGYDK